MYAGSTVNCVQHSTHCGKNRHVRVCTSPRLTKYWHIIVTLYSGY